MTNLLGPQQIITTSSNTFTLNENQFIGINGYQRTLASKPRVGLTSNGNINYKQDSTPVPLHLFQWQIVMLRQDAYLLMADIESQVLNFRQNNARNFQVFTLEDRKLAVIPEALPSGTPTQSLGAGPSNDWVFATWNIVFTSASYTIFGTTKLQLNLAATQVI